MKLSAEGKVVLVGLAKTRIEALGVEIKELNWEKSELEDVVAEFDADVAVVKAGSKKPRGVGKPPATVGESILKLLTDKPGAYSMANICVNINQGRTDQVDGRGVGPALRCLVKAGKVTCKGDQYSLKCE